MKVPYFRASLGTAEIDEVVETLRSGWLTTGPRVRRFEAGFADAVGARHAVAVNSATAALHLAVEALGLRRGQGVLVPTLTFAATAEIVRYIDALPILVDCDATLHDLDLEDAERKLAAARAGELPACAGNPVEVVGIIPVHIGGRMVDLGRLHAFARRHRLWIVEDAAHAFPAAWRSGPDAPWLRCGEDTADVTCFSFYANKTITTGEGGMAVTASEALADRMRLMSLHGLSRDAWDRYRGGSWDYRIVAPGFKYNLTDVAAAIGIHQLARAEDLRRQREAIADAYDSRLGDLEEVETPPRVSDRVHAHHLYPIRLRLDRLTIDRARFKDELELRGVGCSVQWRPLHLNPYYREGFGWTEEHLPVATREWQRLISLPLFPGMREEEIEHVVTMVRSIAAEHRRSF